MPESKMFRGDSALMSQTFAFQNVQLKILDANGLDSELKMKKGEKYQIQIDLEDILTPTCQDRI